MLVCVVGLAAGCGDDSGPAANPPPTVAGAKGPAGAAAGGSKNQLPEKLHVEDRVACTIPDRPSDPDGGKCDPKAPSCPDRLYCMTLASGGSFCEPCPERVGIRHVFKERDFVAEQNRDPFEPGGTLILKGPPGQTRTKECRRDDQFVATTFSYADLKLVGIIAQGTQRKVLMMGGPLGYIIKRGDCVGKEKAVVTDIGTGYITFQIDPDPLSNSQRPSSEYSVQLNPKQLAANDPTEAPQSLPRTTIAPVVPPPVLPPSGARGTTVIVPGTAPAPGTVVAPNSNITPAAPAAAGGATGAGSAMAPGGGVPLVVPAAPGSGAAPSAPAPSVPARVFVPAPKR